MLGLKRVSVFTSMILGLAWVQGASAVPTLTVAPYLQSPADTAMTIGLEVPSGSAQPVVEYRLLGTSGAFQSQNMALAPNSNTVYETRLTGLQTSANYEYRIKVAGDPTALSRFKTWPTKGTNTAGKFIVISDPQASFSNSVAVFNRIVSQIVTQQCGGVATNCADQFNGILIAGDLTENGGSRTHWRGQFFAPLTPLMANVPLIAVPGNHDVLGDGELKNYLEYFSNPSNGSSSYPEQWFNLQYGTMRILGLNTNPSDQRQGIFNRQALDAQLSWLDQQITQAKPDSQTQSVFAVFHHPCLSELWRQGETIGACEIVGRLENFSSQTSKLSGHIFGHTHAYSRGHSMNIPHLWLNSATIGGNTEDMANASDLKDYHNFAVSRNEFGVVLMDVSAVPSQGITLNRYSLQGVPHNATLTAINNGVLSLVDTQTMAVGSNAAAVGVAPLTSVMPSTAVELVGVSNGITPEEMHWQFSKQSNFSGTVFDVWGNDTRESNIYIDAQKAMTDTQAGKSILRLKLSEILNKAPVYVGVDDYFRVQKPNWYQMSNFPTPAVPAQMTLNNGDVWHFRARARDTSLRWSDWSLSNSFTVAASGGTWSSNLVSNGGAESTMSSWTRSTGYMQAITAAQNGGTVAYIGSYYFAGGGFGGTASSGTDAMYQNINMSNYATSIDQGSAVVRYSAAMRGWAGQTDTPSMYIEFYNASGTKLATSSTLSSATATWTVKSATMTVPTGTRSIRVHAKAVRSGGNDNDGYLDNIGVEIMQ
jgi:3',5'-cyclic AMP phosphodiesterase CpdA